MIAIVGAAGKIGYSTSLKLREAGVPVRAILRDAKKATPLSEIGCDIALADLQDPPLSAERLRMRTPCKSSALLRRRPKT
jgi:uncharacterized protein YbjT (DUF2867 family)